VARLTLQSTVVLVDVDQAGRSDAGIGVDDDDDDVVVVVVVVVVDAQWQLAVAHRQWMLAVEVDVVSGKMSVGIDVAVVAATARLRPDLLARLM